jgi:hypothetical protein
VNKEDLLRVRVLWKRLLGLEVRSIHRHSFWGIVSKTLAFDYLASCSF